MEDTSPVAQPSVLLKPWVHAGYFQFHNSLMLVCDLQDLQHAYLMLCIFIHTKGIWNSANQICGIGQGFVEAATEKVLQVLHIRLSYTQSILCNACGRYHINAQKYTFDLGWAGGVRWALVPHPLVFAIGRSSELSEQKFSSGLRTGVRVKVGESPEEQRVCQKATNGHKQHSVFPNNLSVHEKKKKRKHEC